MLVGVKELPPAVCEVLPLGSLVEALVDADEV